MAVRKIGDTHPLYTKNKSKWKLIDDICDSENLQSYLVELNPNDETPENVLRNKQYFKRAVFYAIAGFTARGLVGMPFRKIPKLNVPEMISYIEKNIDAAGTSIYQQSQHVTKSLVRKGRAGLLVEYPKIEGASSKSDLENRKIFANVLRFEPESIIDWGTMRVGAEVKLSKVVISDTIEENGEEINILRVLTLEDVNNNGQFIYVSSQYRVTSNIQGVLSGEWALYEQSYPRDGSGNNWDEIPFQFVGSETNTPSIDQSPMYDICKINVGHFNNSAEHEDIVFQAGQPQYWMSGLTEDHIKMMQSEGMYIGCGRMLGVPAGEQMGVCQITPNTAAREAMKDKVELSVGLGAMFITPGSAVKTATQSAGEQQVQHSILSLIISNVNEAYFKVLGWMCKYMNITSTDCEYTIEQDFIQGDMNPQMIQALIAGWMQSAIPFSDLVKWLQKQSIIDPSKKLEEVQEEIDSQTSNLDLNTDDNNVSSTGSDASGGKVKTENDVK